MPQPAGLSSRGARGQRAGRAAGGGRGSWRATRSCMPDVLRVHRRPLRPGMSWNGGRGLLEAFLSRAARGPRAFERAAGPALGGARPDHLGSLCVCRFPRPTRGRPAVPWRPRASQRGSGALQGSRSAAARACSHSGARHSARMRGPCLIANGLFAALRAPPGNLADARAICRRCPPGWVETSGARDQRWRDGSVPLRAAGTAEHRRMRSITHFLDISMGHHINILKTFFKKKTSIIR